MFRKKNFITAPITAEALGDCCPIQESVGTVENIVN